MSDTDALEIQMISRQSCIARRDRSGRAITLHQSLLQRPDLTRLEHAYVQLCLALDFRHGGFVDRALEAFQEVVRLDPRNRYALVNLQKLHEEQRQWTDALRVRGEIAKLDAGRRPRTGRFSVPDQRDSAAPARATAKRTPPDAPSPRRSTSIRERRQPT